MTQLAVVQTGTVNHAKLCEITSRIPALFITGCMPSLLPNQQCQSTESYQSIKFCPKPSTIYRIILFTDTLTDMGNKHCIMDNEHFKLQFALAVYLLPK